MNALHAGRSSSPQIKGGATNVGRSYRFIYQSNADPVDDPRNLDSAEYANMTLHFIYWYDLARAEGRDGAAAARGPRGCCAAGRSATSTATGPTPGS